MNLPTSDQTILSLPGFQPLQCSIDLPDSGINFGNAGLLWTDAGRRLVVGGGVTQGNQDVELWWVRTEQGWGEFPAPNRSR